MNFKKLKNKKGASLVDYGMIVGMLAIGTITIVYNFGEGLSGYFTISHDNLAQLQSEIEERNNPNANDPYAECLKGTSGSDTFYSTDTADFDCAFLDDGNDYYQSSRNVGVKVHPDHGNDEVITTNHNDLIYYQRGSDTYTMGGGFDQIIMRNGVDVTKVKFAPADIAGHGAMSVHMTFLNGDIMMPNQVRESTTATSHIEEIVFRDKTFSRQEIKDRMISDQQTDGDDIIYGTRHSDDFNPGAGNDEVYAGQGDDNIYYTSGNDTYFPYQGVDVLHFPGVNFSDVSYDIPDKKNKLTITMASGDVVSIPDAFSYLPDQNHAAFHTYVFDDETITVEDFVVKAVENESTPGDDIIYGTSQADLIEPGSGNDYVEAGGRDDRIVFHSGDLYIKASRDTDTLDMSSYLSTDVTFGHNGQDIFFNTNDGYEVRFEKYYRFGVGDSNLPIEIIEFSDTTITEADIRSRADAGN